MLGQLRTLTVIYARARPKGRVVAEVAAFLAKDDLKVAIPTTRSGQRRKFAPGIINMSDLRI